MQRRFYFLNSKKCKFLCQALSIVYKNRMKKITYKTWKQCWEQAIEDIKRIEKCEFDYSDIDECDELKLTIKRTFEFVLGQSWNDFVIFE